MVVRMQMQPPPIGRQGLFRRVTDQAKDVIADPNRNQRLAVDAQTIEDGWTGAEKVT